MDNGTAFALGVVSGAVIIAVLSAVCRERPVTLERVEEGEDEHSPLSSPSPADPENWWARGEESPYGPAG